MKWLKNNFPLSWMTEVFEFNGIETGLKLMRGQP